MDTLASNSLPSFGFLTAVEHQDHGFFGGYLVLSPTGRPLEFHCSTPILPSKAQTILYGSTLRSYVLGELIGQILVKKAQLPVQVILTDLQAMLDLALVWSGTLAWVAAEHPTTQAQSLGENEIGAPTLRLGAYQLVGSSTCRWLPENLRQTLEPLAAAIDLSEPFGRIHEAIAEAQRVAEPAQGAPNVRADAA